MRAEPRRERRLPLRLLRAGLCISRRPAVAGVGIVAEQASSLDLQIHIFGAAASPGCASCIARM